jgi:hypothetical protein
MDIPENYEQQLMQVSLEIEREKEREDEQLAGQGTIGRRIQRIRRDYGNFSHWSRFGSLAKPRTIVNPEQNSTQKLNNAKETESLLEQNLLTVSRRSSSIATYNY